MLIFSHLLLVFSSKTLWVVITKSYLSVCVCVWIGNKKCIKSLYFLASSSGKILTTILEQKTLKFCFRLWIPFYKSLLTLLSKTISLILYFIHFGALSVVNLLICFLDYNGQLGECIKTLKHLVSNVVNQRVCCITEISGFYFLIPSYLPKVSKNLFL